MIRGTDKDYYPLFMMRRLLLRTGILVLLAAWLALEPVQAQRPSPLVYDDPVFEWTDNRDPEAPRPSPNAFVGLQIGSTRVLVAYGSPGVKERTIFGNLVSYGNVWRTGANEATTITFTDDVLVEGHEVPAGTYSLFTIPGRTEWIVILNKKNNQWGSQDYLASDDVLRITCTPRQAEKRERLAFYFENIDPDAFSASVVLHWDTVKVSFKIEEP